jgi:hypothetical protein
MTNTQAYNVAIVMVAIQAPAFSKTNLQKFVIRKAKPIKQKAPLIV